MVDFNTPDIVNIPPFQILNVLIMEKRENLSLAWEEFDKGELISGRLPEDNVRGVIRSRTISLFSALFVEWELNSKNDAQRKKELESVKNMVFSEDIDKHRTAMWEMDRFLIRFGFARLSTALQAGARGC